MRPTPRLFMAALAFALISTTAFVLAQDRAAPVPARSNAVAATNPAPSNAAASAAAVKGVDTEFPSLTGTRGWILLGLVAVALSTSITRYRRRLPKGYPIKPIANLPLDPVPVPVPVPARLA